MKQSTCYQNIMQIHRTVFLWHRKQMFSCFLDHPVCSQAPLNPNKQTNKQGGRFSASSPVIGGLTWSDSFALAERAALLPCKPRLLGLGDDWWGCDVFSANTEFYHISVNVCRCNGTLVDRYRYYRMYYVRLRGYTSFWACTSTEIWGMKIYI